uniref:Uncharacterized protein n=1 Tax=Amphilophus citrinellus TaxID=61819 RepID=A0A3Q0RZ10_AMPCI
LWLLHVLFNLLCTLKLSFALQRRYQENWKEKGEKKDKNDKRQGKAGKEKGERKQWEDVKNHGKERSKEDDRKRWNEYERKSQHQKHDKEWKSKDKKWEQSKEEQWKERGGWNERKHNEDWKKERLHSQKNKDVDKFKSDRGRKEEHQYGDQKPSHTHRKPSIGQPEYWVQQRERLRHSWGLYVVAIKFCDIFIQLLWGFLEGGIDSWFNIIYTYEIC